MAKRIRAKLVLELLARGMSGREIRSTRHVSQRSIKLVREAAECAGVTYDDMAGMSDQEVYDLLFPAQRAVRDSYAEPYWEWVHSELQRDGVTLKLLWEEHCNEAARDGLVSKSYNTFCRGYQYEMAGQSIRNGQQRFRQELIEAYGGACAITKCAVPEALQAAHIIGYRGLASNVVTNGLLLRADVHLLYDSGLLTVDPDGLRVVTSRRLAGSDYSELDGARLELPGERRFEPNRDYLAVKFKEFEIMDRAS